MNKLWGCVTTSKSVERLMHYPFFFANNDHCLVIAEEQPKGTVEMTDEFIHLFKEDDWSWLNRVIPEVQLKQMEEHPEEAKKREQQDKEFLERFRTELMKRRGENGRNS